MSENSLAWNSPFYKGLLLIRSEAGFSCPAILSEADCLFQDSLGLNSAAKHASQQVSCPRVDVQSCRNNSWGIEALFSCGNNSRVMELFKAVVTTAGSEGFHECRNKKQLFSGVALNSGQRLVSGAFHSLGETTACSRGVGAVSRIIN